MKPTYKQLEAELEHVKRIRFYTHALILLIWAVGLGVLVTYEYKTRMLNEVHHFDTTITPAPDHPNFAPQPQTESDTFKWPITPWIEAMTGISAAHAAPHPMKDDLPQLKFDFASPLKIWKIEQLATDRSHLACSATRSFGPGVLITFTAYKDGTKSLVLTGVGFNIKPDKPYADTIVSVDGAAHVQVVSKRVNDWETSVDLSSLELTQLSNGKILRVTINNLFAEFDLTGSANAAKYVAQCNSVGPLDVLRRRVEVATPAVVLETTK